MSHCTLNPFLAPHDAITIPEWLVAFHGRPPVGPVSAAQIAHGIKAGDVPSDARIARAVYRGGAVHSASKTWEDVLDARAVLDALKSI